MSEACLMDVRTSKPAAVAVGLRGRRFVMPILCTLALFVLTYGTSPNFRYESSPTAAPYAGDFLQEWLGGHIVLHGDYARFYELKYAQQLQHDSQLVGFEWKATEYFPIVYPPFYYLIVSPLSALPYRTAVWVWAMLMIGSFAGSAAVIGSAYSQRWGLFRFEQRGAASLLERVWPQLWPWTLVLAAFYSPFLENLISGQKGAVCLLILVATFVLLTTHRPFAAGLIFGLLAFKPQYMLVIPVVMLWKREWRFMGGMVTTGGVLVALSLCLGWDVCWQFVRFSTGAADYIRTGGYAITKAHCLYGFFTLLNGGEPNLFVRMATLLSLVTVGVILRKSLRGPLTMDQPEFACQFSALVIATLLVSPHCLTYDLTLLLLPFFLLCVPTVREAFSPLQRCWASSLGVALYALGNRSTEIATATSLQVTTVLMVALLGICCCARQPAEPNESTA